MAHVRMKITPRRPRLPPPSPSPEPELERPESPEQDLMIEAQPPPEPAPERLRTSEQDRRIIESLDMIVTLVDELKGLIHRARHQQ